MDPRLKSKWWRLTHLYKIRDKNGRTIIFKPNHMQVLHLAEAAGILRILLVKARQFGFTTLYCIDMLDDACFVPGSGANAIIAHERESVNKIFQIVKRAYEGLPPELRPAARKDTEQAYRFDTRFDGVPLDTEIYVALKIRSSTVRRLHITESAYIKDRQELEAGSKQAVPLDGRITEETTGNGFGAFYDQFMAAYRNPSPGPYDEHAFFHPWFENPDYSIPDVPIDHTPDEDQLIRLAKSAFNIDVTDGQLAWRRWKMRSLKSEGKNGNGNLAGLTGEQLFKQEYPSTVLEAFQSGAGSVFDAERIEAAFRSIKPVIRELRGLRIWFEPRPGHRYMVGCDPSDGMGADYGAISVWDVDTLDQVAQYVGKLRPDELADKCKEVADIYLHAFVGIENNMLSTILFFIKIYDNYYVTVKEDKQTKERTEKIGWTTSGQSRDIMIDEFIIAFDEGELGINSPVTLSQMQTFVKKDNGKREHAEGKHDDVLFADMIAYQLRKNYPGGFDQIVLAGSYDEPDDWNSED